MPGISRLHHFLLASCSSTNPSQILSHSSPSSFQPHAPHTPRLTHGPISIHPGSKPPSPTHHRLLYRPQTPPPHQRQHHRATPRHQRPLHRQPIPQVARRRAQNIDAVNRQPNFQRRGGVLVARQPEPGAEDEVACAEEAEREGGCDWFVGDILWEEGSVGSREGGTGERREGGFTERHCAEAR